MNYKRFIQLLIGSMLVLFVACSNATQTTTPQSASTPDNQTDTSSAASETVTYEGVDVSVFQGDINWDEVKGDSITFAFAKATQGETEVDPKFADNWSGMKSAGITRGAYHFFDPTVDATAQAEHFIATVTLEEGDLLPMLDIEVQDGLPAGSIDADIKVWLEKVAEHYGVKPIIYSDDSFLQENLSSGFSDYPLWVAAYSDTPPPTPIGSWDSYVLWQYSDTGSVSGISGNVDRDRYQGTEEEWQKLLVPSS